MRNRYSVGQLVMFNAFPRTGFCKDHIYNGALCKVIRNLRNTVRVIFRGQITTDIVAPSYLRLIVKGDNDG